MDWPSNRSSEPEAALEKMIKSCTWENRSADTFSGRRKVKCFVIMPFAKEFIDVYATIKGHVESAVSSQKIKCQRLDDTKPAGRITDRLLSALRECSFCVADLSGCSPNVMWETGYAMALGKPVIVVTQNLATLPFDVKDMQALGYDRNQLNWSLGAPLREIIRDTASVAFQSNDPASNSIDEGQARLITALGVQLAELKEMVGQIVRSWNESSPQVAGASADLRILEGAWIDTESESHIYVSSVNGQLIAPYCWAGNHKATAYFYDWKKLGDYFFARFSWLSIALSGFTFLKLNNLNVLHGAWWTTDKAVLTTAGPPAESGSSARWERREANMPSWASAFLDDVRKGKIRNRSIPPSDAHVDWTL
jgi:nucleoside 2-deoxyribosyltransferase